MSDNNYNMVFLNLMKQFILALRLFASSAEVDSRNNMTSSDFNICRTIAMFCFSPPDTPPFLLPSIAAAPFLRSGNHFV